jgi:hypothetical protein
MQVRAGNRFSQSGEGSEHVVLPFPVPRKDIAPVTRVRSTSIVSSLELLRKEGHYERYLSIVSEHRNEILSCVAGAWLHVSVARTHYEACDALNLSLGEQVALGRAAAEQSRTGWISQALRVIRAAGATPWSLVGYLDRMWQRGMNGGAVAVFGTGPKEARLEFIGCELFEIPYFCRAYRGVIDSLGAVFSTRHYTQELPRRARNELILRTQWV